MKYIPLEDVMKLIKMPNMVVYFYKIDELTESVQSLPTIDPIQIIDEMIEENIKGGSIGEIAKNSAKMEVLQELKSRLSLTE